MYVVVAMISNAVSGKEREFVHARGAAFAKSLGMDHSVSEVCANLCCKVPARPCSMLLAAGFAATLPCVAIVHDLQSIF